MAHDPLGRGDLLARGVAERLRARGVDAVAVPAPIEQKPDRENAVALRAGASRLIVLDLRTQADRKIYKSRNTDVLRPGTPEHPYNPNIAAGPMLIGPTMAPIGTPGGAWGWPSDEETLYVFVPQLPYGAVEPPTEQRVAVRTQTHIVERKIGALQVDVDQTVDMGAMTSWRKDLVSPASQVREQKTQHMWNALLGEIADRSATLVARR
jgi:hypothetical protein